jgi:hypothetical protein
MDSIAEKLKLGKDKLKRALEACDIESITIIDVEQFDKKADLVNLLKMDGVE